MKVKKFNELNDGAETPKLTAEDLSSSELDDYITAKYEPMKQDFKLLWDTAKDEDGYKTFENWWCDYLKEKFEIADEARRKG